jgi:RND superfamily putative drug exporter
VLISGLTVMAAMAGMFLTGEKTFMSFAMATILVVAIAVLGSLTVLPALLSRLGDKVNKGRIPFLQRFQKPGAAGFGAGSSTEFCAGRCSRLHSRPASSSLSPHLPWV